MTASFARPGAIVAWDALLVPSAALHASLAGVLWFVASAAEVTACAASAVLFTATFGAVLWCGVFALSRALLASVEVDAGVLAAPSAAAVRQARSP